MAAILIVDDDARLCDSLSLMMHAIAPEREILVARNGKEALETLYTSTVDIIFTDIKMPVCDGIRLLELLGEQEYGGKVVVISGFDAYDLVRNAMRLGATDYLLKPVNHAEMALAYQECVRSLAMSQPESRRTQLASPMRDLYQQRAEMKTLLSNAEEWPPKGSPLLLLLNVLGRSEPSDEVLQSAHSLGAQLCAECCPELAPVQGDWRRLWVIALASPAQQREALLKRIEVFLATRQISFGFCLLAQSGAEAVTLALRSLERSFYDLPAPPVHGDSASLEALQDAAVDAIVQTDHVAVQKALFLLFARFAQEKPEVRALRRMLADMIYTCMQRNKEFISVIGQRKFTDEDILGAVQEATSFSVLQKDFLRLILLYIDALLAKRTDRADYAINRIRRYVEERYPYAISLSEVSERLGLHPNYVSTMFHHKIGRTFMDYVRSVRIAHAVELMQTTSLKIYEIGKRVGYSDNAQFYRAFKQSMGCSPSQYAGTARSSNSEL
ncbi:MAG: response regulator [Clostridia bacterium]